MSKRSVFGAVTALVLLALAFGAFRIFGVGSTIPSAEAHQLVESGARLVDVRTPSEFADGHVDGAVNIPVDELGARMTELGDPADPVVLYCRSGARSGRAKRELEAAGFTQVHNLGAMTRW